MSLEKEKAQKNSRNDVGHHEEREKEGRSMDPVERQGSLCTHADVTLSDRSL